MTAFRSITPRLGAVGVAAMACLLAFHAPAIAADTPPSLVARQDLPLHGKTILFTTPRNYAGKLGGLLIEHGARPVWMPTIVIEPMRDYAEFDRALTERDRYDWFAFTSRNGIEAFFSRLEALGLVAADFAGVKFAAIGNDARALEAGGIELAHVDFGGGIGIAYQEEPVVDIETYAAAILQATGKRSQSLWFEPGRYIVGEAGILVARVLTLKENEGKRFAVIDAAMNDLLRPALYDAWQRVSEVHQRDGARLSYDIVGPVCETGDFLAKGRSMCLAEGDLVAIHDAGAYGFVMSSNYNSRNRPAEVMVAGSDAQCVRERESIDDQLRLEHKFKR